MSSLIENLDELETHCPVPWRQNEYGALVDATGFQVSEDRSLPSVLALVNAWPRIRDVLEFIAANPMDGSER